MSRLSRLNCLSLQGSEIGNLFMGNNTMKQLAKNHFARLNQSSERHHPSFSTS